MGQLILALYFYLTSIGVVKKNANTLKKRGSAAGTRNRHSHKSSGTTVRCQNKQPINPSGPPHPSTRQVFRTFWVTARAKTIRHPAQPPCSPSLLGAVWIVQHTPLPIRARQKHQGIPVNAVLTIINLLLSPARPFNYSSPPRLAFCLSESRFIYRPISRYSYQQADYSSYRASSLNS